MRIHPLAVILAIATGIIVGGSNVAFYKQLKAAGIEVRPDQVTLENLDSPARILDFAASEAA